MSKKSKSQTTENQLDRDLATFEQLPERTKELMKLKERQEKATGHEQVVTTRKIKNKARKTRP